MLKFLGLMVTVVVVMVLGVGGPNVLAQEWKTYFNPEYKFTMQYPDYNYLDFNVWNNSTQITLYSNSLIDYTVNMGLSIQPLNTSEHANLLSFVEDIFDSNIGNDEYYQVLQNITSTEYASYPAYTFTYSSKAVNPNDHTIHKSVYQLHNNLVYIFWMANSNEDYHGEDFDKMVNSIKFFN